MVWYKQTTKRLFEILDSSDTGITNKEANERLKKYGPNQVAVKKDPLWRIIIEPFKSIFIAVLALAAAVSLISHEPLEAVIVGAIIVINSVIFYTQQYATTRVLRTLKKQGMQQVAVVRQGAVIDIPSVDLVPGDILHLTEGERIPADARIVHVDHLQIDESALTGESVPIHKHASTLFASKPIYEQDNMAFQGTYVVSGQAKAIVVETGSRTEFAKIAELATDNSTESPVQIKIDKLISTMIKGVATAAGIVFVLSIIRGIPYGEALRFVLSLSVAAVPEGLPVALTAITVLGMRRMAKQKALVRSFKAIEDIGLVTTIATDKTGTLTKNRLSLIDQWSTQKTDMAYYASLTLNMNEKTADPLDRAIVESIQKKHLYTPAKLYPFDTKTRMSGAYIASKKCIYIKGSPEHILEQSNISQTTLKKAESAMHKFASKGYRVIALAKYPIPTNKPPENLVKIHRNKLEFIGLLAFADELRPEASEAIRQAKQAGISVRLITGDHYETAYNIGKQVGLTTHPSQVVQGVDLPKEEGALASTVTGKTIFARILPEDKFKILNALKTKHITAMTGDGVNDVPALANAHVGIAMGSGSDIAKDAGGIILMDDNFATIVKAIAEGRKIFANIRRILFYLLTTSLSEIITMIGALILGLPLPVTAIQILWINLVTETALVLPLGLEAAEPNNMERPPRNPNAPLLDRIIITRMLIVAATMGLIILATVILLNQQGYNAPYIQTVAFMSLIVGQWANAFNARSEYLSVFSRFSRRNIAIYIGLVVAICLQAAVIFGPLQSLFGIERIPATTLLLSSSTMIIGVIAVGEAHKYFYQSRSVLVNKSKE